jgi:hypothetical protein
MEEDKILNSQTLSPLDHAEENQKAVPVLVEALAQY